MPEQIPRLLLPGTLCDERLFAPMCSAWDKLPRDAGQPPAFTTADLHTLGHDPSAWWRLQLAVLPETFDVVGFSLGGVLAMSLLHVAPSRVRRMALIATNTVAGTAQHRQTVQAHRQVWHTTGPTALADQMMQETTPTKPLKRDLYGCVQAMAEATPHSAFYAQGEVNANRSDGLPALRNWRGPLLLLSGAADPWCGPDKQQRLCEARPDAQVHVLEAGHYLPLELPDEVARLTNTFFN